MDDRVVERVRHVQSELGLPDAQFAAAIGSTKDKYSKSINGHRNFSTLELAMVAELGRTTVDWLLRGVEVRRPAAAARAHFMNDVDEVEAVASRLMESADQLSLLGSGTEQALPVLPAVPTGVTDVAGGNRIAEQCLAMLELPEGKAPSELPYRELLERIEATFGIDIAIQQLPENFDGCSWQTDNQRLIILRSTDRFARQRFTLAHELGHIVAGHSYDLVAETVVGGNYKSFERWANAFAATFLMPESWIQTVFSTGDLRATFNGAVARLKVSPGTLSFRLFNLKMIDQVSRDALRSITAERCLMSSGHAADIANLREETQQLRIPPRLVEGHVRAYGAGESSARPLASLLGISVDDVIDVYDSEELNE